MKRFRAQWPRFNRCVIRSILSSRSYVNLTETRKDCLRKTGSFAYDSRSMRGLQRIPITAALHQPRRASRLKSLGAQSLNDRNLTGPSEGRLGMKARPGRWLTSPMKQKRSVPTIAGNAAGTSLTLKVSLIIEDSSRIYNQLLLNILRVMVLFAV